MRADRIVTAVVLAAACLAMNAAASADCVAVGGSALIGTLDYSDSFTTAAYGGNAAPRGWAVSIHQCRGGR